MPGNLFTARRGFSIVELSMAMAVAVIVLALGIWAIKGGVLKGHTSGAAKAVTGFLEQAAALARARGIPVGVAVARSPHPSALLLVAGTSKPVVEGKLDLAADFPGTELAFAAGVGNEEQTLALSGLPFDMSSWSSALTDMRLLVFLPSGEVLSKGIPWHTGGYQILISAGLETGPAPDFVPTRVAVPQTVVVSMLGEVTSQGGAGTAFGEVSQAAGALASEHESSANPPAEPPPEPPVLTGIEIQPDPEGMTLPSGADALVAPTGYLTLTAVALSPSDIPLYCRWTDEDPGRLSAATRERMTYDPARERWVSRWHWRPSDSPPSEPPFYQVKCQVTDEYGREAEEEVNATLSFELSNAKQKVLYVTEDYRGAAATLLSIYEDGSGGAEQMVKTPPGSSDFIGAWAPDGAKLMVYGNSAGNGDDMYIANADGSDLNPIEQEPVGEGSPEYGPLGTQLCFISPTNSYGHEREVAVMNADGSNYRQLTSTPDQTEKLFTHNGTGYLPGGWSFDEKHIAYGVDHPLGDGYEIWVVDVAEPNDSRKVSGTLDCSRAVWSPSTHELYIVTSGDGDLYVYRPDPPNGDWSAAPQPVTTGGASIGSVQISPDGGKAIFNRSVGGIWMCSSIPAPGEDPVAVENLVQLTTGSDSCPAWLDNETISFVRSVGGQRDICTRTLADAAVTNVTKEDGHVFFQGWTPDLSTGP